MKCTFENPKTRARSMSFALLLALSVFSILPFSQTMSAKPKKEFKNESFTKLETVLLSEKRPATLMPPAPPSFQNQASTAVAKMEILQDTPMVSKAFSPCSVESFDFLKSSDFAETGTLEGFSFSGEISQDLKFEVFEFSQLDKVPKRVNRVSVKYPPSLLARGIEGKVEMLVLIDENGNLTLEKILKSTNPEFEESAKNAVKNLKYESPVRDGKPVRARFILPMPFTIKNF